MQKNVTDLSWEGKTIPVKVSYMALMEMTAETGVKLIDIASEDGFNFKALESLFYWSMVSGCHKRKIDPLFSREDSPYVWEDLFKEFSEVVTMAMTSKDNGETKKKPEKRKQTSQSQN